MPFVKLDCAILDSSLWLDREARDVFLTALLMAVPREIADELAQLEVSSGKPSGWLVPPGSYGLVEAAGVGIVRRAGFAATKAPGLRPADGLAALARLGEPESESRSPAFDGRRLVRVDGGYLVLNYMTYRLKAYRESGVARAETRGYVYYVRARDLIKIGFSKNPWARLSDLRVAVPDAELLAVEAGSLAVGRQRHDTFRAHHQKGEWFRNCPALQAHVVALGEPKEPSYGSATVATGVATKEVDVEVDVEGTTTPPTPPAGGNGTALVPVPRTIKGIVGWIDGALTTALAEVRERSNNREARAQFHRALAALVFGYSAARWGHQATLFDEKRERRLVARLRESGGNVHELLYAADGAMKDAHLAGQRADSDRDYLQVSTVFRDREQVERLARRAGYKAGKVHKMAAKHGITA